MSTSELPDSTSRTILLVDDEHQFLCSLAEGLATIDPTMDVVIASHGGEALEILAARQVDLMMTDLKMQGIDGFELLERVVHLYPELPVMVMTSVGSPDIEARASAFGISGWFDKPLDLGTVMAAICSAVEKGNCEGVPS